MTGAVSSSDEGSQGLRCGREGRMGLSRVSRCADFRQAKGSPYKGPYPVGQIEGQGLVGSFSFVSEVYQNEGSGVESSC